MVNVEVVKGERMVIGTEQGNSGDQTIGQTSSFGHDISNIMVRQIRPG